MEEQITQIRSDNTVRISAKMLQKVGLAAELIVKVKTEDGEKEGGIVIEKLKSIVNE